MTWNIDRARKRVAGLLETVPQVMVESYSDYLPRVLAENEIRKKQTLPTKRPLVDLPPTRAVLVDTVQVYATLVNYENFRLKEGRETEESHAEALAFLHLHYGACDRVIEGLSAQRVDFHGARVHAVVIEPSGAENARERVLEGLDLAQQIMTLSALANSELGGGRYAAQFRIGIDAGPCIAINSGQGSEQEPLFLGSAANHAAKLASGTAPGIFVSDRVRAILNLPKVGTFTRELTEGIRVNDLVEYSPGTVSRIGRDRRQEVSDRSLQLLEDWKADMRTQKAATGGADRFKFHHHQPPLESIEYEKLSPGNSIRMPLMSVFADLDGYTAYVDQTMRNGTMSSAVRALHVIRGELKNVLQEDFDGRKVRFIGDCVHGLLAEGTSTATDLVASIRSMTKCAGGMRSSFLLCQEMLPGTQNLGLAIGMELGPTPVTRIGIRGDRSVRIASSVATSMSEALQQQCNGRQTAIGPAALNAAPADIKKLFSGGGRVGDFTFDDADMLVLSSVPRVTVISSPADRPHAEG